MSVAVALAGALALLAPHPDSRSSSQITVEGGRATVVLRCQVRSMAEALAIDANQDGALMPAEFEVARDTVGSYLLDRYQLYALYEGESSTPIPGVVRELELLSSAGALSEPWLRATLTFEHERDFEALWVRVRLFREQNPLHRDEAQLIWNDRPPLRFLFGENGELWAVDSSEMPGRRGFLAWFEEGVDHILGGLDHLAFVFALLLAVGSLRSLAGVVTAFTVAHSITLALAVLGWVQVSGHLIELAIALSIAYVALLNLMSPKPSSRWPEAFVFGLVHGFGFATFLGDLLFFESSIVLPLFGFNLGVESGQLLVVIGAAILLRFVPGERQVRTRAGAPASIAPPQSWLAPRWLRLGGSALIAVAGLVWFARRAGFWGA